MKANEIISKEDTYEKIFDVPVFIDQQITSELQLTAHSLFQEM